MSLTIQNKNKYKPQKLNKEQCEEYMNLLQQKCEKMMPPIKKLNKNNKITDENIFIPSVISFDYLFDYNYNTQQLKVIAKNYKLKITGNKQQMILRIYTFLKLSIDIIKIQKILRGFIQRKYNKIHGPAFIKRSICTNDSDFLTGDDLINIPFSQFISFSDVDGFIYGFDIISLYNLILKLGTKATNPYNRNAFPENVLMNVESMIRISKLLNIPLELDIKDDTIDLPDEKTIELRVLSLFQNIDALGNYSSPSWFHSLNRNKLIKMLRELVDIWEYRAQITNETKRAICPPNGIITTNVGLHTIFNEHNIDKLKKYIIEIMEKLVNSGIDQDSKSLGAYYVLGALTIVNENAATSLPWLFQSFSYFNS
jgi:hypothetical protein